MMMMMKLEAEVRTMMMRSESGVSSTCVGCCLSAAAVQQESTVRQHCSRHYCHTLNMSVCLCVCVCVCVCMCVFECVQVLAILTYSSWLKSLCALVAADVNEK